MKKKFVDNINNKPEDGVKGHKNSVKKTCKNVAFKNVVAVKEPEPAKAVDTGEDLYLLMNGQKLQFSSQISSIYDVKEYFLKTVFTQGSEIKLARKNGSDVPVHHSANCGFTLVGKAQNMFTSLKALCANGETSDDQEYVYINEHSVLEYSGKSGEHTLFVRVYDNLSGVNNDRWVVIYID
ncbi:MAG: hypothetical protein WCR56_01155 [Bacilli bacterium]